MIELTNPLSKFKKNNFSQFGEDGIIEKILEILPNKNLWCVEFGAHDGIFCSNTHNLIVNQSYKAVKIESNKVFFNKLVNTYKTNKNVITLNKFVDFQGNNTLDNILLETKIPYDFDLLSIDIDGNDYHIWDSLKNYRPKLVIIEFNHTIPNNIIFINPKDMKISQGSSILAINNLAKSKNYELIATTDSNAFFIDSKYFSLFNISDNSVNNIRDIHTYETYFFQLYDGTIILQGYNYLIWHSIKIKNKKLQLVPKIFRKYPGNMNKFMNLLLVIYRKIINKF